MEKHIKTVEKLDRNELINGKKRHANKYKHTRIPLSITYNQLLAIISKIIEKNETYYHLNPWKHLFQNKPVTIFKHNKNFKELIDSNKIESNIVGIINKSTSKP